MSYNPRYEQQQHSGRYDRKPGTGRVWPNKRKQGQRDPDFTGEIALPDGRSMRIALWESFADRGDGPFNGFSVRLSEDTRQSGSTDAQARSGGYSGGYRPGGSANPPASEPDRGQYDPLDDEVPF
jgi:hypothetical protein